MMNSANISSPPATPQLLPIIVGVTGHRDLRPEDIPSLEQAVEAVLTELRQQYPDTPLLLLSPLAEGADRLVARVGLKPGADGQPSARLVVPLPLPRAEYEKDFNTPASQAEFHDLIEQAVQCFVLPLLPGNTAENIRAYGEHRNAQYAQVGAYIVRHSQILIALWDGDPKESEGGTAQIVRFKRTGIAVPYAPPRNPLDAIDTGPVYHILTPRLKNPDSAAKAIVREVLFPDEGDDKKDDKDEQQRRKDEQQRAHEHILKRMNVFNQDVQLLTNRRTAQIQTSKDFVIPAAKAAALSATARTILEQYALADALALHFQRKRRHTLIGLFAIAVLAVVSFEVYAHLLPSPWILLLYLVTLGLAFTLYRIATRYDYQHKHLDYRALAEGLRVQLFWHLAGLPHEVAEHYLRQHRSELDWIRNAIRAWNVPAVNTCLEDEPTHAMPPEDCAQNLRDLVLTHWVEDQQGFFQKATKRDHHKLHRHEDAINWLFRFGLVLASLLVVLDFALPHSETYSHWHHWLIVVMGTAPAIAAAMGGYAEKMAFAAQERRYRWMSALFTRACTQLQQLLTANHLPEAQALIFELGKEALEENGDWVLLHRERTPDYRKN